MMARGSANATVKGVTFGVWALAAASAVFWGLKLSSGGPSGPAPASALREPGPVDPAVVARLLGHTAGAAPATAAAPAAPPLSSRFNLLGVVADRSQQGAALIAVEGRAARPYRVGSLVGEGLVLQSVQPRRAVLAASMDGPPVVTLELPVAASQR